MSDQAMDSSIGLWPGESDDQLWDLTLAALEEDHSAEEHWVPKAMDDIPPGPYLGAILSTLDPSKLRGADVVTVMRAQYRQMSHHQAGTYRAIAEVAYCLDEASTERSPVVDQYAIEEIGAALSYTRRKATHELGVALDLRTRLPEAHQALASGIIDPRKASLLTTETSHLDEDDARAVVSKVLEDASDMTTGQLGARLRRLCIKVDPEQAEVRMARSLSERRVIAEPNPEGTAALVISQCAPDGVYAARDHINLLARQMKTADEPRNIDQLRADVAICLLTGQLEAGHARAGSVTLSVDLTTLTELANDPGELAGYGPVVAEVARKVAREQANGEWNVAVTDPETGEPLHVVALRRRPTVRQLRKIRALHPTCTFVGCRMPAVNCDIDHIIDYARGGRTVVCNHAPLCRRHHMAKHQRGWRYRKVGRTRIEWTSPLGHRYQTGRPP